MRHLSKGSGVTRHMAVWMLPAILSLLMFTDRSLVAETSSYIVETDEESGEQLLLFIEGEQQHEVDKNAHVTILQEADFDGDGAQDVLVATDTGGSCCPPEYAIHSWVKGSDVRIDLECDREPEVVKRGSGLAIRYQTIEKTKIAVVKSGRLEVVETIPQLKALKELHSLGRASESKQDHQILNVDMNDDGVIEEIRCEHWEFQGSMLCSLPLLHGETQDLHLSCDRFGMLAAKNNGSHQFVCNNDILFVFDGYRWDVSNPETELLAERIQKLEQIIGNFPPAINNDKEKDGVKKEYEGVKAGLDALLDKETFDNGMHLRFLRGDLQAMGHNFDYPQSWEGATKDLQAVLEKDPLHISSLLVLGRLWVNSRPDMAPEAEKIFLTAQCGHGPEPLEEAQRGLFFSLYYQGKMVDALRQANYLATTWPKKAQYQEMAEMTRSVLERAKESDKPRKPLTSPPGLEDCQKDAATKTDPAQ
jgi:hypothetical protein